jgi:hypothetical protein
VLRQGRFAGDVLIYSPQATVWSQRALFGTERRVMPYGNLGKTLVASGYDYDPVNDDVLQRHARVEGGEIAVRDLRYRFLVLPRIETIPVETFEFVRRFALAGGAVIALDCLPSRAAGMAARERNDARVRAIAAELFAPGGRGTFLPGYKIEEPEFSPAEKPWTPTPAFNEAQNRFIAALRARLAPDFELSGGRASDGLTFIHRRDGSRDIYFVTNLQPNPSNTPVTFRVDGKSPELWDPRTGTITPCLVWSAEAGGVRIPLELEAWGSVIVVFSPGGRPHVTRTNLTRVLEISAKQVRGVAAAAGEYSVEVRDGARARTARAAAAALPPPLPVPGPWGAWTADEQTKFFSGTKEYQTAFELPAAYAAPGLELTLDLGPVGSVAEVFLNGARAGVDWMRPYRLDVTKFLHAGRNSLRVLVTNTAQNYVTGLKDVNPVPQRYAQGAAVWRSRDRNVPPPMSGLPGPVTISAARVVTLQLA